MAEAEKEWVSIKGLVFDRELSFRCVIPMLIAKRMNAVT